MANWTVKPYYKKSIEECEYFEKDEQVIICRTNWRFGSWSVTTTDDNPPEFEFTYLPGGDGKKDSIDMCNCEINNIESCEMIETVDGGWDIEFPEDMDEEEQESLQERIEEDSVYSVLEDEDGWYHSETERWIWGPIEILDEQDNRVRLIVADEEGNVVDFKED